MNAPLFKINLNDLGKGAITAFCAGLIFALGSIVNQTGFNVFTADYAQVFVVAFNAGLASFVGYLSKQLLTDGDGQVLGFRK